MRIVPTAFDFSSNDCAINIDACVDVRNTTHSTPIDCALDTVKIMSILLTNQITGIFGWGI